MGAGREGRPVCPWAHPGVDGDGSGGDARVTLSWGEQLMSALPSPPGKSCCSQAAAFLAMAELAAAWLPISLSGSLHWLAWLCYLEASAARIDSLPGTALGELGDGVP